jgi:hypothetical protein
MDKVVYILGAGFSAPLGLPVMSNFLVKSKDLYFSDTQRYRQFQEVFRTIDKLSVVKNYFSSDLFNIEEILSILEMQKQTGNTRIVKEFSDFISTVIKYYTPPLTRNKDVNWPSNWYDDIFRQHQDDPWENYGFFVASLLGLEGDLASEIPNISISNQRSAHYSVVTLNYDLVLENVCEYINSNLRVSGKVSFDREKGQDDKPDHVPLAKLHGSVDTGDLIPPTWNKSVNSKISGSWRLAHKLISEANHIRIIGYSLPTSDAYIKYLLKSAVAKANHLKSIDVICRDNDGSVKARYDEFVKFNYYQFFNRKIEDYLKINSHLIHERGRQGGPLKMTTLERTHEIFILNS